jgi:hypothetical protein
LAAFVVPAVLYWASMRMLNVRLTALPRDAAHDPDKLVSPNI